MEFQKSILLFLASIRNGFLNRLMELLTVFGEETLLICIIVFIYWNISKKKGYAICMSLLTSAVSMEIIKAIVRFPRPWTVIEDLEPLRVQTADDYSFPSGHTANASSGFSALALSFGKKWLTAICIAIIVIVPFTRLYLGVHWPTDVLGGLAVGLACGILLTRRFLALYDDKERCLSLSRILAIVSALLTVFLSVLLWAEKIDEVAFANINTTMGMLCGALTGFTLERRAYDFQVEEGHWGRKVLRFVIGMIPVAFFMVGLKPIFVAIGIYNPLTRALRYFLVGLWACGIYPLVGKKFKLFV